jgi:fluoride ion exporter CrcB/FEX
MLEDGEWEKAALYVAFSAFGGVILVAAGIKLADRV